MPAVMRGIENGVRCSARFGWSSRSVLVVVPMRTVGVWDERCHQRSAPTRRICSFEVAACVEDSKPRMTQPTRRQRKLRNRSQKWIERQREIVVLEKSEAETAAEGGYEVLRRSYPGAMEVRVEALGAGVLRGQSGRAVSSKREIKRWRVLGIRYSQIEM
ncbi:hypothetical protein VTI74DRAFT_7036 [Chaetomium olivicolor]